MLNFERAAAASSNVQNSANPYLNDSFVFTSRMRNTLCSDPSRAPWLEVSPPGAVDFSFGAPPSPAVLVRSAFSRSSLFISAASISSSTKEASGYTTRIWEGVLDASAAPVRLCCQFGAEEGISNHYYPEI